MQSKFALKISWLTKVYPSGLKALDNVDFSIPLGGFVALLGENGAGKSTLINILSGLIPKTEGSIEVFGQDVDSYREETKLSIGIMPQEINLSIFEKCIDIVTTVWGFYGVPYSVARPRAEKILTELGLGDKLESTARVLSWGMKRRLMLARALIHEPKLLILDEPTAWVDVALRRGMWEYLQKLQKDTGMTILLTTHYLEEVEALCDDPRSRCRRDFWYGEKYSEKTRTRDLSHRSRWRCIIWFSRICLPWRWESHSRDRSEKSASERIRETRRDGSDYMICPTERESPRSIFPQ